ncbi:hypothetical protein Tco_0248303 [Tanacetum coccineum]
MDNLSTTTNRALFPWDKGKDYNFIRKYPAKFCLEWAKVEAKPRLLPTKCEMGQTREQYELTDEEKAKLFMEFIERRRKHFATLSAQEKRNRPPTKAQKRNQMPVYLKHMGGYKHNQLKGRSYNEIQKLFGKEMKRVNSFVAMNLEAQEISGKKDESSSKKTEIAQDSSAKRAGDKLESDESKKQKTDENEEVEEDNEAELKMHMVIVKDDDIAIDAIPLATKPPVIVEYKLIKEGIMGHYQLIRADGSSKRYSSMIRMLQGIDREDLETLWKLVKTKHGDTRPEDEHERVLWGDLKVMFEPDIKSDVWRNLQGYKVTIWKLFDSCGVHFVRFGNVHIFMLVEKRYPLTPITITNMLNKKLQADYWNKMCYQLLKLMFRGGLLGLKDFKMILRVTAAPCCWYKRKGNKRDLNDNYGILQADKLRNRSRIGINKWYQSVALRNFDLEVMEFESAPRNKEGQFKNQDNTRKHGNNEDTSSKVMLAIDGVGFDWSDMAKEQVQTNMALMAFLNSEVYNDKTCSKTCLKNYETLKKQCDDLIVKLNQTEFTAATYKRGLATIEEQLITYRKNEVLFSEEVAVLKRGVACKYYEINVLKSEFEKVKQEKEGIEFKIEKFDKASKYLNKLLGSQITDKSKKGLGYSVVLLPHPLIYNRPKKLDLSYSGLDEFKEPEFKGYGSENSKQESNIVCDKKSDDSKENSDDSLVKEKLSKDTSSLVESSLNVDKETIFPVDKKVEFVKPKNYEKPVKKSVRFIQKVNTAKAQAVNTARPKAVKTARPNFAVVNAVRVNQANAVKASACWVWRPTKPNSASITLKKHNYIDARGRSKASHNRMTQDLLTEDEGGQDFRADGSSKRYSSMIRMLQGIDREDLETLWKLVKTKHGDTRPEDEHERVLWGDLKVMFEPDIKSDVWRNLQGYKVTI